MSYAVAMSALFLQRLLTPFRRPPVERSAAVYRANGRLLIGPYAKTTEGLTLNAGPVVVCELNAQPGDLAAEICDALSASGRVVPHPARGEWSGGFDAYLKAARVRSYKAFMLGARCVDVQEMNGNLVLTPHRNLGSREGFEPLSEQALTLPATDLLPVAEAVLALINEEVRP